MRLLLLALACLLSVPALDAQARLRVRESTPSGVSAVTVLSDGARPRYNSADSLIVFDCRGCGDSSGFVNVFTMTPSGASRTNITAGQAGLPGRTCGNAWWSPDDAYLIFGCEAASHYLLGVTGIDEPGVCLYCNLFAYRFATDTVTQLTDIPIKLTLFDGIDTYALVNARFNKAGTHLYWTERYAALTSDPLPDATFDFGEWRVRRALWTVTDGVPSLSGTETVFTPGTGANYVTLMDFFSDGDLLISCNCDGQHEYFMDLYRVDAGIATNLTNTTTVLGWEEGSIITPQGRVIYTSDVHSRHVLNPLFNWPTQLNEKEYYVMNADGSGKRRLTRFNQVGSVEYAGNRVKAAELDINNAGSVLLSTYADDESAPNASVSDVTLRVVKVELHLTW